MCADIIFDSEGWTEWLNKTLQPIDEYLFKKGYEFSDVLNKQELLDAVTVYCNRDLKVKFVELYVHESEIKPETYEYLEKLSVEFNRLKELLIAVFESTSPPQNENFAIKQAISDILRTFSYLVNSDGWIKTPWYRGNTPRKRSRGKESRPISVVGKLDTLKYENERLEADIANMVSSEEFAEDKNKWLKSYYTSVHQLQVRKETYNAEKTIHEQNKILLRDWAKKQQKFQEKIETEIYSIQCDYRRDHARTARALRKLTVLIEASYLSPEKRLEVVARLKNLPPDAFPKQWACTDSAVLGRLSSEIRGMLIDKLYDRKKGPWRNVFDAICDLDESQIVEEK